MIPKRDNGPQVHGVSAGFSQYNHSKSHSVSRNLQCPLNVCKNTADRCRQLANYQQIRPELVYNELIVACRHGLAENSHCAGVLEVVNLYPIS